MANNALEQVNVGGSDYNLSVPFVVGTGSTAGTWLGSLDGLTEYYDGLLILYKPSVAGASTTTLNINSLGAKTCYINNTTKLTTHFPANQPILLVYSTSQNSGCWMCIDDYWTNSDTYTSAYCGTAAATAAKDASMTRYTATPKSFVHINFRYANTVASALTLNINSQGAKPIYINGTASSATNHTLPAGPYIAYYDGTNYYFRTDGKLTANITGDASTVNSHTVAKDVPSDAVFTDTNTKVTQSKHDLNKDRPLLMSYAETSNNTTNITDICYRNNAIYANANDGSITVKELNLRNYVDNITSKLKPAEGSNPGPINMPPSYGYLVADWSPQIVLTNSFQLVLSNPALAYHEFFVAIDIVNPNGGGICVPLLIPLFCIGSTSSSYPNIFRGGWFQNGSNGGECEVRFYKSGTDYYARYGTIYLNGADSSSSATVSLFYR